MSFPSPPAAAERTDRPGYRLYDARVDSLTRLSPHFVRVRLRSDDFGHFGPGRRDQRIKLIFPNTEGLIPDLGPLDPEHMDDVDWYGRWREMPDEIRPPFRTYTVREIDHAERVLDVDFVDHGDAGVAGHWLATAAPGDEVFVAGPDGRSIHHEGGIDFRPGGATRILLAGDETAVPAIAAILERLPDGVTAQAFCEVPSGEDVLDLTTGPGTEITWLPRGDRGFGEPLVEAIERFVASRPGFLGRAPEQEALADDANDALLWDVAEGQAGGFYAWLAGEAGAVKRLRRLLVSEHDVDRRAVSFMGYWRLGQSET